MRPHSLLATAFIVSAALTHAASPLIKSGETVAFLGDSITQQGAGSPGGYVQLVASGLAANGIEIKIVPAGISGHKSNQMRDRLESDVLAKKPNWMTLSCGVNDVWHGEKGVSLEDFKTNITDIVDRCQAAGVKVLILTATQIKLPLDNPENVKLAAYNTFLRDLAKERNLALADLNADMASAQKAAGADKPLTADGVHMNHRGNIMMANGVLRAFGLDDKQLSTASEKWNSTPGLVTIPVKLKLSLAEMDAAESLASARKQSVEEMLSQMTGAALKSSLPGAGSAKPAKIAP